MTNRSPEPLVEDDLRRDPRIRAPEHDRERSVVVGHLRPAHGRGERLRAAEIGDEAGVAVLESAEGRRGLEHGETETEPRAVVNCFLQATVVSRGPLGEESPTRREHASVGGHGARPRHPGRSGLRSQRGPDQRPAAAAARRAPLHHPGSGGESVHRQLPLAARRRSPTAPRGGRRSTSTGTRSSSTTTASASSPRSSAASGALPTGGPSV